MIKNLHKHSLTTFSIKKLLRPAVFSEKDYFFSLPRVIKLCVPELTQKIQISSARALLPLSSAHNTSQKKSKQAGRRAFLVRIYTKKKGSEP